MAISHERMDLAGKQMMIANRLSVPWRLYS